MRGRTPFRVAIGTAAVALLAAGCTTTPPAETTGGGELRAYLGEPAFLLPTAASDSESIAVIREVYRGLVKYNKDTGAAELDLAESIESDDNINWTIKIKPGYKFDNGEAVNADAFLRAWNYTAYAPNAQDNAYFFGNFAGLADVSFGEDPDGDGPLEAPEPVSKTLPGLKKVDDLTFTVELASAFASFPATIGYSGFFPVAEACLDDTEACNEAPIGNGPYKIEGKWEHESKITVVKNPDWTGTPGVSDKIIFTIYTEIDAAYAAFEAGDLDVMDSIPPAEYKAAKDTYGEALYEKPSDTFTYVGFPLYNPLFQDKRVRQALSLAIDRQAIIDSVFNGRFTPATGVVSPNFAGARAGVCKNCLYDPTKAKSLLAAAGGWPAGQKLILWANAGAGHDTWLQAVGDQIKENLGIEYELKVDLQFAEYLATADADGLTGPFRLGWAPDYPVLETYLTPLYGTGSGSNNARYTNPAFDDLVKEGNAADSEADAIKFYQQAEDIIVEDLPVIPMWFGKVTALYNADTVDSFVYNTINGVSYGEIVLK